MLTTMPMSFSAFSASSGLATIAESSFNGLNSVGTTLSHRQTPLYSALIATNPLLQGSSQSTLGTFYRSTPVTIAPPPPLPQTVPKAILPKTGDFRSSINSLSSQFSLFHRHSTTLSARIAETDASSSSLAPSLVYSSLGFYTPLPTFSSSSSSISGSGMLNDVPQYQAQRQPQQQQNSYPDEADLFDHHSTTAGSFSSTSMVLNSSNIFDFSLFTSSSSSSASSASPAFEPEDALYESDSLPNSKRSVLVALILAAISLFTITGNLMVIWAIFHYRPLHQVQNMYLVSLAVADIAVAVLVMPFNVAYNLLGKWIFGLHLCEMWLTSDVLCCTASILNLCAIAMDRYWAIHDPINYAQKRNMRRVVSSIGVIWVLSALISIPPLIGWNDWPEQFDENTPCKLSEEKSYLIYSSSGSFFIPLVIMAVVYFKIFKATRRRLKDRAKASAMANLGASKQNSKNSKFCAIATVSGAATHGVTTTSAVGAQVMKSVSHDDSSSSGSPQSGRKEMSVRTKGRSNRRSSSQARVSARQQRVSPFELFQSKCLCCCSRKQQPQQHQPSTTSRNHHLPNNNNNNGNDNGSCRHLGVLAPNNTNGAHNGHTDMDQQQQQQQTKIEIESASDSDKLQTLANEQSSPDEQQQQQQQQQLQQTQYGASLNNNGAHSIVSTCKSSQVVTLLEPKVSSNIRTDLISADSPTTGSADYSSMKLPSMIGPTGCSSGFGNALSSMATGTSSTTASQPVSVKTIWEQKQKISLSRERRATRILGIVMGVFVACWLPFFLMYVIVPFCESCYVSRELEGFITWLGYINSALNPLIYCGFNRDFRRAFQRILSCKRVGM